MYALILIGGASRAIISTDNVKGLLLRARKQDQKVDLVQCVCGEPGNGKTRFILSQLENDKQKHNYKVMQISINEDFSLSKLISKLRETSASQPVSLFFNISTFACQASSSSENGLKSRHSDEARSKANASTGVLFELNSMLFQLFVTGVLADLKSG